MHTKKQKLQLKTFKFKTKPTQKLKTCVYKYLTEETTLQTDFESKVCFHVSELKTGKGANGRQTARTIRSQCLTA